MDAVSRVLVLNSGSSSLKWSVLDAETESTVVEGVEPLPRDSNSSTLIGSLFDRVPRFDAVGHRVVHGGQLFRATTRIDPRVRADLELLVDLDPLHMKRALAGVDAVRAALPLMPQFAAFDTAFHATLSEAAAGYALPFEWTERWGLRRFGFHGLSVAHSVRRAREMLRRNTPRLVVCHLGSGCSVTAVQDGHSVDTTMGFTPLEGLVMATRSGSVDPGLLLYLELHRGVTPSDLFDALTMRSGLLGVSGVAGDLREVLSAAAAGSSRAALAYEQFILAVKRAVGAMVGVLSGLDGIVFTGGIGENSARVRQDVASALLFAGVRLDEEVNRSASPDADVAHAESRVPLLVIHAREDLVMLRDVVRLCGRADELDEGT